mgnify:CR=1 FL=1
MPHPAEFCASCGKEMFEGARFCTYCGAGRPAVPTPSAEQGLDIVFEVKKIGVWSLVKLFFMINAVIGLVFGMLFASFGMFSMGMMDFPFQMDGRHFLGTAPWIAIILVCAIFYGFIGSFLGLIAGSLYNILAWGTGGILITLKKK